MDLQHNEPAWRNKADFIIGAKVVDSEYAQQFAHEQLWAKKLEDGLYEICCIPFALYDLFLGDVVNVDKNFEIERVSRRSGHFGFRVATKNGEDQDAIAAQLHEQGYLTERHSDMLLAVDADDLDAAQIVANLLQHAEGVHEIIQYETIKK